MCDGAVEEWKLIHPLDPHRTHNRLDYLFSRGCVSGWRAFFILLPLLFSNNEFVFRHMASGLLLPSFMHFVCFVFTVLAFTFVSLST